MVSHPDPVTSCVPPPWHHAAAHHFQLCKRKVNRTLPVPIPATTPPTHTSCVLLAPFPATTPPVAPTFHVRPCSPTRVASAARNQGLSRAPPARGGPCMCFLVCWPICCRRGARRCPYHREATVNAWVHACRRTKHADIHPMGSLAELWLAGSSHTTHSHD